MVPAGDGPVGNSNVVLHSFPMTTAPRETGLELLPIDEAPDEYVVSITLTASPEEHVRQWSDLVGDPPAHLGVVSVGATTPDRTPIGGWTRTADGTLYTVIDDPADLTGIQIRLWEYLDRLLEGARPVVYIDSLTVMLQYVELDVLFRFLHHLTGHVKTTNGGVHTHIDPTAHEERTRSVLAALFDSVVGIDEEGEWTVVS